MNLNASAAESTFQIQTRDFFSEVLNQRGLLNEGAEVGVQRGYFSRLILNTWKGRKLYSIDPWKEFSSKEYVDPANVEQKKQDQNFRVTTRLLKEYGERSVILRKTSEEAALCFADGSLDFVYLDAQHHYEAVVQDIRLWWPKVKPHGILAGHDYVPDFNDPSGTFGVKSAVDEFVKAYGLSLILSDQDSESPMTIPSWFVLKP